MTERCKEKHWWSGDPHNWKYYGEREGYNSARECLHCSLMQIYEIHISFFAEYKDATKNEFDTRLQEREKEHKKTTIRVNKHMARLEQIEKDRLENLDHEQEKKQQ